MNRNVTVNRIASTPEASGCLMDYYDEIIARRRAGDLHDVSQYASRWCEQAARIAVVLHAGLHGAQAHQHRLALETAEKAVRMAEWFARQQLNLLAKGRLSAAEKVDGAVLELLESNRKRKGLDFITARDVHRARIVPTPEGARTLLARMEVDGLLTSKDATPDRGGRATLIYRAAGENPVPG